MCLRNRHINVFFTNNYNSLKNGVVKQCFLCSNEYKVGNIVTSVFHGKIANVNLAECTGTKTVGICLMKNQYQLFSLLDNSKAPEPIRIHCKKSTVKNSAKQRSRDR